MKSGASLEISCSDPRTMEKLASVLAPDNEGSPRDLKLVMRGEGRELKLTMEADAPSALISTVLALIRDVELFQEVWLLSQGQEARTKEPQAI